MLAGDRSRGAISPASIVASLVISRIVCIGTYSISRDFGAYTSFYAYWNISILELLFYLYLNILNTNFCPNLAKSLTLQIRV